MDEEKVDGGPVTRDWIIETIKSFNTAVDWDPKRTARCVFVTKKWWKAAYANWAHEASLDTTPDKLPPKMFDLEVVEGPTWKLE